MIIDIHRHMWSVQERYRDAFAGLAGRVEQPVVSFDWAETTREIVEEMDEAGVDKSVLLVADFEIRLGEPPFGIDEENRFVKEARDRYPDRIIALYGIDPRRPGAADKYEKAIKEWGVSGIKLHPAAGFFPHDRACYPLYELCASQGLPVLFHSGPGFHPRLYSRFSHPLEFDEVAADFPNMTMIMGHAGGEWWSDCVAVAHGHPNMVLELSEWQVRLRDRPGEWLSAIHKMRNSLGRERVVWGSDFPGIRRQMPLREVVELFQNLPFLGSQHGLRFDEDDVEAILGGNASLILGSE